MMNKKDLKRLKRSQLLELLIAQTKEHNALRRELDEVKAKLNEKEIHTKEAGSIAQASLKLNGVFEAAQSAADQYIENLRRMETEQQEICQRMREAEKKLETERAELAAREAPALEPENAVETEVPKKKRSIFRRPKKEKK